jgi:glutaconate CoA-transferase subunit A
VPEREVHDKLRSVADAVRAFVPDGCRLRSSGIGLRKPMAFVYEVIRQRRRDLTFLQSGMTEDADLLLGAGCLSRIEGSYVGLEAFGLAHCYRRSIEQGVPRKVLIEEYSNFGMTMRFMAEAMGVPFMPIRSHLGSDLLATESFLHPKSAVLEDPFGSGAPVALLPACPVDVALLHAQRCDEEGNVQLWGQIGDDQWGTMAGKRVLVSVEEIVPTKVIRRDPNRTVVPGFRVDAIVPVPFGSHPYQVQGYYDADVPFRKAYAERSASLEGWQAWADEWIYGVEDHDAYLRRLGSDRLDRLRAKRVLSGRVNYGY